MQTSILQNTNRYVYYKTEIKSYIYKVQINKYITWCKQTSILHDTSRQVQYNVVQTDKYITKKRQASILQDLQDTNNRIKH